jgi:hypothetical protein
VRFLFVSIAPTSLSIRRLDTFTRTIYLSRLDLPEQNIPFPGYIHKSRTTPSRLSHQPAMPHIASHAPGHAAAPPLLPYKPMDCPVLIAMIIDPLLGSLNPKWQLCAPEYTPDYMWPLATALWLLILYTAIRGVEKSNGRNARILEATGGEGYEMMELRSRR